MIQPKEWTRPGKRSAHKKPLNWAKVLLLRQSNREVWVYCRSHWWWVFAIARVPIHRAFIDESDLSVLTVSDGRGPLWSGAGLREFLGYSRNSDESLRGTARSLLAGFVGQRQSSNERKETAIWFSPETWGYSHRWNVCVECTRSEAMFGMDCVTFPDCKQMPKEKKASEVGQRNYLI